MDDPSGEAEQIYRGVAGFALLIGVGALLFPRTLLRLYGVDPNELSGAGEMGWRLFAVRNIFTAAAAISGDQKARDTILALQAPDLVIFAHCFRTRSVPRLTSVLAMFSAGGVAALGAYARSRR